MSNRRAVGTGRSSGTRVLLRLSGGFLMVCLNIVIYIVVVYLIYKAAIFSYDFAYEVMGNVTVDEKDAGRDVRIQVLKGETSMNVAAKLETNKIIVNKYSFFVKLKLRGNDLMPGTYQLNTSMTYDEIIALITDSHQSLESEETVEEVESTP